MKFLPLHSVSDDVDAKDKKYIDMLKKLQEPRTFFFSYKMDLTKRVQVIVEDLIAGKNELLQTLNPNSVGIVDKFAFNHNLLEDL